MTKAVVLGGGEFTLRETDRIDKTALDMTGKYNPKVLYIPTASGDTEKGMMTEYYKSLGVEKVDELYVISDKPTYEEMEEKVMSADYIFNGGGDAILLMDEWKKCGLDKLMRKAFHSGIVVSGISAGSIACFEIGHTDSLSYHDENWDFSRMHGCGLIPAIHSPHFDLKREKSLTKWMETEVLTGVGLENNCSLCAVDGKYSVLTSDPNAKAHIFRNQNGKVVKEIYTDGEEVKL